jgi:hypothetical protein
MPLTQNPPLKEPPTPTTTTDCYPDVPLPTGVEAAGGWQLNDRLPYRVVLGEDRGVTDHNVVVHTVAIQFADGRIEDGRIKAAPVYSGRGLSSTQARELAAALLEAADQLDGWIEPSCAPALPQTPDVARGRRREPRGQAARLKTGWMTKKPKP